MHESTTITADGNILTWREYIDEQMALDADASEADEGIPFAVAECPPVAAYKRVITRGLAVAATALMLGVSLVGCTQPAERHTDTYPRHDIAWTMPSCADELANPTDGACKAYDEAMHAAGYVQTPQHSYVQANPGRGV